MTRAPWDQTYVHETPDGPDLVFDNGVFGWPVPCTDQDLYALEEVLVQWRHAREAEGEAERVRSYFTPFEQCRVEGHNWPSAEESSMLRAGDTEACGRCKIRRHVTEKAS
jgi:hypothetical protein